MTGEVYNDIVELLNEKVIDREKIYNRTDNYKIANEMAAKIREYNSNYFVIVISNYGWESLFSENLAKTL